MTAQEEKTINRLYELMSDIKKENESFKGQIKDITEKINSKVESKIFPITLEQDILSTAQTSIQSAINESLTKYDSPLIKLVTLVVSERSQQLKQIISDSFDDVIKTQDFKQSIRDGFAHKVAKTIISKNDGLVDKVCNELKQDAIFKSKLSLAVANVVNECLEEKKPNSKISSTFDRIRKEQYVMSLDMYLINYDPNINNKDEFTIIPTKENIVCFWNKAIDIHQWIMQNIDKDKDEWFCRDVTKNDIVALMNYCKDIIENNKECFSIIQVQDTIKLCEKLIDSFDFKFKKLCYKILM